MDTLVLKLKGKATSNCSKKENEILLPVTYDSSVDGNEYGVIVLNVTASNSTTGEYSYNNLLKITDKKGNYKFGTNSYNKDDNSDVNFDAVNGVYQDELICEGKFLYGSLSSIMKIFSKKRKMPAMEMA